MRFPYLREPLLSTNNHSNPPHNVQSYDVYALWTKTIFSKSEAISLTSYNCPETSTGVYTSKDERIIYINPIGLTWYRQWDYIENTKAVIYNHRHSIIMDLRLNSILKWQSASQAFNPWTPPQQSCCTTESLLDMGIDWGWDPASIFGN